MNSYLLTSKSVSEGHPDKLADQVSGLYLICVALRTLIMVETYGTDKVSLTALVREHFYLHPKGILKMLNLLRPIYIKIAAYGCFGCDEPEFSWEAIDKAAALKASVF